MKLRTLIALLVLTIGTWLVITPAQRADSLAGWTHVRSDLFDHYACKQYIANSTYGPLYKVNTVSFGFDKITQKNVGVYTKITRNGTLVNQVTNTNRLYGMIGTSTHASAWYDDKLWIQGSYYGPAPANGVIYVKNLINCH